MKCTVQRKINNTLYYNITPNEMKNSDDKGGKGANS